MKKTQRNAITCKLLAIGFVVFLFAGCNADQIAAIEAERDRIADKARQIESKIATLDQALDEAEQLAKVAQNEQARAEARAEAQSIQYAKAMLEIKQKRTMRAVENNEAALRAAKNPNQAIIETSQAVAPILPPPFNYLMPILVGAIFGETARRRGNKKVQRVGEVLEMSGVVSFDDIDQANFTAGEMGPAINAELSKGRDKAKAQMARVNALRPKQRV